MRECDRLKWALFCGYNPIHFPIDCCGLVSFMIFNSNQKQIRSKNERIK